MRFRKAQRSGKLPLPAIHDAIQHVGRAVIVSSLVLLAAFWSLTVSPSAPVASFGLLAGIAVLAALVADLFVLPSMVCTRPLARYLRQPETRSEVSV